MNRLETHTNPLRLFLFVGKDEGAMQRNEMLFCKGRMGNKKNHFLSFGRMQPTSCTKGTKDLAVPNISSPCYCHIAAYLNNVFVKPNKQCRACSNIVMARKRTFKRNEKQHISFWTCARPAAPSREAKAAPGFHALLGMVAGQCHVADSKMGTKYNMRHSKHEHSR